MLRAAAVSLALLFAMDATPAFAQSLPPGTYRQSCNNIRVRGQQLIASCSASNGGRVESSTSVDCRGDIGNVNGSLRCNPGNGPTPAQPVPPGTYRQSCTDVRVRGQQLIANCSAANGGRIESSISVNCVGDIGNVNGRLRCNPGAAPAPAQLAPQGSYRQSCTNIRVQGQQLIANCSAPSGRRIVSSIPVRCRGDIGNVAGYLTCNRRQHRR